MSEQETRPSAVIRVFEAESRREYAPPCAVSQLLEEIENAQELEPLVRETYFTALADAFDLLVQTASNELLQLLCDKAHQELDYIVARYTRRITSEASLKNQFSLYEHWTVKHGPRKGLLFAVAMPDADASWQNEWLQAAAELNIPIERHELDQFSIWVQLAVSVQDTVIHRESYSSVWIKNRYLEQWPQ